MQIESILLEELPALSVEGKTEVKAVQLRPPTAPTLAPAAGPRSGELKSIPPRPPSSETKPPPVTGPRSGELKAIPPRPPTTESKAAAPSPVPTVIAFSTPDDRLTSATAVVDLPDLHALLAETAAPAHAGLEEGEGDILVLCLELRGIHGAQTVPSKEAASALTALLAKAAGWVEDAGGVVESTRFDEMVALWSAHAPHAARRALAVAFRLTAHASSLWVEGRPLTSGVGVHVGRARIARPGHGELAALGPAAAVARKLASISSGATVASEQVLAELEEPVSFESAPVEPGISPVPARTVSAPAGSLSLDV
jgi:class 3 adenylate cyclase